MKERIFLASPHMGGQEEKYVKDAFDTNWIAPLGPHVNAFEKELAAYVQIKDAAALSAGTAALHLALKGIGIKPGDLVICSSLTFSASCNPIMYEKAIPIFIDSEPESWNMSPKALEAALKEYGNKIKAAIVVNLYGQSAKMDAIMSLCDAYNVPVIEDAAESLGATYKGKMSGTFGQFGVYSFNGNKIITTSGGGMLVSNDSEKIQKARFWATQAREPERHYEHKEIGYNYRLSNVCAAIGRGQLEVLEERIKQKKHIFDIYKETFSQIADIEMMPIMADGEPNYWLSVMTIKEGSKVKPLDIMLALEKENIESRPVWKPMHLQPIFKDYEFFNHNDEGISVAEDLFNRGVCLPSDTKMTDTQLEEVAMIIKALFR